MRLPITFGLCVLWKYAIMLNVAKITERGFVIIGATLSSLKALSKTECFFIVIIEKGRGASSDFT